MTRVAKSSIMLISILLLTGLLPVGSSSNPVSDSELSTTLENGVWVNNTLSINGSTNIAAQNANWALYDVTDVYSVWPVLRSGDYFSHVTPIDENAWNWSITIDVQGLSCTCWLEVIQPDGLSTAIINRVVFIGIGPHNPLIQRLHEPTIIVDEPKLLTTQAFLPGHSIDDSKIFLSWCHAPNGACDGDLHSSEVNVSWDLSQQSNIGSFTIDATELELYDGAWQFSYVLQDMYLRTSPKVSLQVLVDQTDPQVKLNNPSDASEGETIIVDGSDSSDGVWSSDLQPVWYITEPDGSLRVANQSESNGMLLTLNPTVCGNYSIQLDVFDNVGRRSSETTLVTVHNIAPSLDLKLNDFDELSPNSWEIDYDEVLEISALVDDTGTDKSNLIYQWYINDVLVSNDSGLTISELDEGVHKLRIVVLDDDGESDSLEMDLIVKGNVSEETGEFNILAVVFVIVIFVGVLLFTKRISKSENESTPMPKWSSSKNNNPAEKTNVGDHETDIWNDSI